MLEFLQTILLYAVPSLIISMIMAHFIIFSIEFLANYLFKHFIKVFQGEQKKSLRSSILPDIVEKTNGD